MQPSDTARLADVCFRPRRSAIDLFAHSGVEFPILEHTHYLKAQIDQKNDRHNAAMADAGES